MRRSKDESCALVGIWRLEVGVFGEVKCSVVVWAEMTNVRPMATGAPLVNRDLGLTTLEHSENCPFWCWILAT